MARPVRRAEEVESLLNREQRARLPLAQQILLYLDPFRLFKDATTSRSALAYNRAMRWILVPYIRRWIFIAASFFLSISSAKAAAAAFAVGACIAVTVCVVTLTVYVLLGTRRE